MRPACLALVLLAAGKAAPPPASAEAHAERGTRLLSEARIPEARRAFETALRLRKEHPQALGMLARVCFLEGRPGDAVALLEPSARSAGLQLLLAEAHLRSADRSGAAALFDRILAQDPHSPPEAYVMAGGVRLRMGQHEAAAEIAERGMRVYPNSDRIEALYLSLPGPVLASRIQARLRKLEPQAGALELIALGRVLTDLDPGRRTDSPELAERLLSQAVERFPDQPAAHYNYARALRRRAPSARLLAIWDKALSLGPDPDLRMRIHTLTAAQKRLDSDFAGAEAAYRLALEDNRALARHTPETAFEYCNFLKENARPGEARQLLQEILGWDPLFLPAHLEMARLFADGEQWDRVIQEGELILLGAGNDDRLARPAHALLARAYSVTNQPEKARLHAPPEE